VLQWRDYLVRVRGEDERRPPTTSLEWPYSNLPHGAEKIGVFYNCQLSLDTMCRVAAEMVEDGWIILAIDSDFLNGEGRETFPRLLAIRPRLGDDLASPEWRVWWEWQTECMLSRDGQVPLLVNRFLPEAIA
jgi:hypothetical protein